MDRQQAQKIVDGLRAAAGGSGAVVELLGQEARNFKFVKEPDRKTLLGSFRVEGGSPFFVSVVSSPRSDDDFGFTVYERPSGNVILASNLARTDGIHWKYQPSKQRGDNQARKAAFIAAVGAGGIVIPFPTADISVFNAAVRRAIELRHLADGAGGADDDDEGDDVVTDAASDGGAAGGLDFEGVLARLADKQLSFSAELVASYLLALQAKRFVLLSGISGTGKTRLAQEIARMFGRATGAAPTAAQDAVEVVAKPSQLKYSRFIVPSELAQELDALTNPEVKRIDLKVPGRQPESMAFYKNPERGNLFYVSLSGAIREWFATNIKIGERFLLSRRTAGEKEWLELALPIDRRSPPTLPAYELIAVRPDWTDARALLGFYNPLTKSYLPTKTLKLLLRAEAEVQAATDAPPRPYFLIFDEMNLARVEHYFSDFLSVMESGEAIDLHDDPQVEEEQDIPRRFTIPKNVFVIGTVNVDETTYMFSPKVLDRAFVLEFNEVDLDGLAGPVRAETAASTPLALVNLAGGLALRGGHSGDEWKRFASLRGGEVRALLGKIHEALAIENRHFGYRVAREVARFVDLAVEQAGAADATVRAALDVAVLAKILPKLHGSQAEIEATLTRLLAIAIGDQQENASFSVHGALVDGADVPCRARLASWGGCSIDFARTAS